MYKAKAYSAASATSPLASTQIQRRATTERDVQIEILFCGVCHSDLHTVRNEWRSVMPTTYPCVPGHEIVGKVTVVGLGGLGHMGVKLARAFGARVLVFTTSPGKKEGALRLQHAQGKAVKRNCKSGM